jgi:hypothetical protein
LYNAAAENKRHEEVEEEEEVLNEFFITRNSLKYKYVEKKRWRERERERKKKKRFPLSKAGFRLFQRPPLCAHKNRLQKVLSRKDRFAAELKRHFAEHGKAPGKSRPKPTMEFLHCCCCRRRCRSGMPDFSWYNMPKTWQLHQMAVKVTKGR